ncbi:hypothetical protein [Maricaulis sp.]|uniref:hypothetical protein n=1 Tax=Maricaulis sp. TaxID=1486257 RepID=UPI003296C1A7
MTDLFDKDVWRLADVAEFFGETVSTARRKIAARERAGFPRPRAKVLPNEPYKWDAAEVRAWDARTRGQVPDAANDSGPEAPSAGPQQLPGVPVSRQHLGAGGSPKDHGAARARLLARL